MDYRYQHHRGDDRIRDGDCDDDSTENYESGNHWQEFNGGSVDNAFGDVFEDEPPNPSSVTFFEGASNFVIDGGSFINNNGGSYADFEWESETQIPLRSPPSKSSFFKGSRDFVISDAHTPKEYSSTYRKPQRPRKKRQEQGDKSLGPSRAHGHTISPVPPKVRKSSSKPAPTFPEPHSELASDQAVFVMHAAYHPQDESGIIFPTPDYQTRTRNGDHDTDYFSPFSMPQPQEVDPSANWRSPTAYSTSRAFDACDTVNPVLEPQPQRFSMPQPVRFPDSPKS